MILLYCQVLHKFVCTSFLNHIKRKPLPNLENSRKQSSCEADLFVPKTKNAASPGGSRCISASAGDDAGPCCSAIAARPDVVSKARGCKEPHLQQKDDDDAAALESWQLAVVA